MRHGVPAGFVSLLIALCLLGLPIVWIAGRAAVGLVRDSVAEPESRSHWLALPIVAIVLWYVGTHWGR